MKEIKLKSQPRWMVRMLILVGAILGGVLAFISHPMGTTNAQSIDCPEGKFLATGNVCITDAKDIVIQATSTAANQTLRITKYFANAYTVDWGDGSTVQNLTSDTTHTYATSGTYTITLSLSGADRWTFQDVSKPLVPQSSTTVTGVQITYMPSLADGFGNNVTAPGDYFFYYFNRGGSLTSLPAGSFDTSNISGTVGTYFFSSFNYYGSLTSLPAGSFDTSNITTAGNYFFHYFNSKGSLTSLPAGSFDTSNITTAGNNFFYSFNRNGSLTSLPAGSFDTSNISGTVGDYFFASFNYNGSLTSLPAGSFDTSNITTAGNYFFYFFNYNGNLTSLPAGSFRLSTGLTTAGSHFFTSFNVNGSLTSLPAGSFDTSNISEVEDDFFYGFNREGSLTSLPDGSFDTSNITTAGSSFFVDFNRGGSLTSLPDGSFDTSNITTAKNNFFNGFNRDGSLTSLPAGSFDTSNISGTAGVGFFASFNDNGSLTSLPAGSFDTRNITTAGGSFFAYFNNSGSLTSLPAGSFDTSNITTAGHYFFYFFNNGGSLTSLPAGSFDTRNITTAAGGSFFAYFNNNGSLTSLPAGSFDTSNITTAGNYFFYFFNNNGSLTSLPDSFKLTSAAYNKNYGYTSAFNSPNYSLNRNVYDLVSGVTAPWNDRNTFSDNQPGRCGVHPNWLVTTADGNTCYTITWENDDGTTIDTTIVEYGVVPTHASGSKANTAEYTYTFAGWSPEVVAVTADATYRATYISTKNSYTITWENDDGTTIDTTIVEYGETPTYADASKANTAEYTYTFAGWTPSISSVTGNATYTATYTSTKNSYTITFVDGSGEKADVVWTGEYGSETSGNIDFPLWTKNGYTLSWSRDIPDVVPAENIVITAIWTKKQSGGNGGGGGGGSSLKKDNCPDGDYSDSYYDGTCGKKPIEKDDEKDSLADPQNDKTGHNSAKNEIVYDTLTFNPHYSDEMNKAYQYSYHYGITTKNNIRDAAVNQQLTRIAMAKMLSQYAVNVLGIKPDATRNNEFADVSDKLDTEYGDGVTLAYQLGIMGINMPNNKFRPYGYVTRAEFATALSRLLYKTSDGEYEKTSKYYVPHIDKLAYEGILTNTDPYMKELRGYVMLMLMRSAK